MSGTVCTNLRLSSNLRWEARQGSLGPLSFDWLLDTDETLELRTKPKVARRAAGRAEKPGGRRPDWPGLSRRLLGVVSGPLSPDLFCSPGDRYVQDKYAILLKQQVNLKKKKKNCDVTENGGAYTGNVLLITTTVLLGSAGKTDSHVFSSFKATHVDVNTQQPPISEEAAHK